MTTPHIVILLVAAIAVIQTMVIYAQTLQIRAEKAENTALRGFIFRNGIDLKPPYTHRRSS